MKKYFLTTSYKFLYSVICLFSLVPLIFFLYPIWKIPVCNVLFFLMIGIILLRTVFWIGGESITITGNGIEYDTPGMNFEVKWDDFEKITHCWRFAIRQEGLSVDQSKFKIKKWLIIGNTPSHALYDFPQKICIPLNCFANNWRKSELGLQIKQHAPHLF
jgi:energy-coupling factor transporter transmembrane protein EcfT